MHKRFKAAVTFGRFNLLHKGHLDLFKNMAGAAKEIVIGVSTGPNNLTYRQRRRRHHQGAQSRSPWCYALWLVA